MMTSGHRTHGRRTSSVILLRQSLTPAFTLSFFGTSRLSTPQVQPLASVNNSVNVLFSIVCLSVEVKSGMEKCPGFI